jgi:hypothetical protein
LKKHAYGLNLVPNAVPQILVVEVAAKKVAQEIDKRRLLLIELGADESEEFGEPLWYLSNYLKIEFEKHKPLPHIIVDGRLDPIE